MSDAFAPRDPGDRIDDESLAHAPESTAMAPRRRGPRRGLVIGARVASGTIATGVAALSILVVGLVPLPSLTTQPRAVIVDPAPADQVRVCPGSAMRIGDASGAAADSAFALGVPLIGAGSVGGGAQDRVRLTSADAGADPAAAPEAIRASSEDDALVAGAQVQALDQPDFRGYTAASCTEPSGSIWLVGGATTVGRTTLITLANPTEVAARVSLEIFGEDGRVSAPGTTGIDVPAGGQRVVSLAGYAPGLDSPVVHVTARGGRVTADLQQSIVRGLDAVGVEVTGAAAEPAPSLVIPGVRIVDAVGTGRASALADWQDVGPAIRVGVPGDADATITVRVVPQGETEGASFEMEVAAGTVGQLPLDSGISVGATALSESLQDGVYTVYVEADVPVVAAARASTAVDSGVDQTPDAFTPAPPSDLAWFAAAPPLGESALVVVPDGPSPVVSIANPTGSEMVVELALPTGGAEPIAVTIPANSAASVAVDPGAYLLTAAGTSGPGPSVAVSFAAPGALAAYVISPPRPAAGPIVIRPD